MDLQTTKGKRGRPKGSKNKPKNDAIKLAVDRDEYGSLEESASSDLSIVSQVQSFRNSILEHLKIELFGKGNDSALSTPPMNISVLSTSTTKTIPSSHSQSLSFKHHSSLDSASRDLRNASSNLNETANDLLPKKRGRPRLSEVQKRITNKISESLDLNKYHKSPNAQTSLRYNLESELVKEAHEANHSHVSKKLLYGPKSGTEGIKPVRDLLCISDNNQFEKSVTDDQASHCPLKNRNIQNDDDSMSQDKVNSIPSKLLTVEKVLQDLKLSPSKISLEIRDGNEGSVLAQIFTKSQVKSGNPSSCTKNIPSRLHFSDKIISSYSRFCKRRMVKRRSQMSESKILLKTFNGGFDASSLQKNVLLIKEVNSDEAVKKENILPTNNGKENNVVNGIHQKSLNIDKCVDVFHEMGVGMASRCTGVQCVMSPSVPGESQTEQTCYQDKGTQTDIEVLKEMQTSNVSIQVDTINFHGPYNELCSKCSKCSASLEKGAGDFHTPSKSIQAFSSSFLGNLNLSKFDGLLNNPSILGDVPTNNNSTINVPSSFFDSNFLNDLFMTPIPKDAQIGKSFLPDESSCKIILPQDSTSSVHECNRVKAPSTINGCDKNINLTSKPVSVQKNLSSNDAVGMISADDDIIIRGSIPLAPPAKTSVRDDSTSISEQSKVGTFLDEGFINGSDEVDLGSSVIVLDESCMSRGSKKRRHSNDDEGGDVKHKKRAFSPTNGRGNGVFYRGSFSKSENRGKLIEKARLKSPTYKKIRRCTYVDAKPTCKDYEPHSCDCKVKQPGNPKEICCGDSCLNRLVYTECHPSTCPTGDKCSNRRIQKRQWVEELVKFQTKDRGYGVKSLRPLSPGQFIIEYCGEVVSENEFRRRMVQKYCNERHHYCLNLDSGMVIDGYRMGNISRFINHSCHPNCAMEKWNVNGVYRMGLFAIEKIEPGAELTYDYNFHAYNILSQQICKCSSQNCRGLMAGKNQRIKRNEKIVPSSVGKHSLRKVKPGYLKNTKLLHKQTPNVPISLFFSSLAPSPNSSKMISIKEKIFARDRRLFLQRNVNKVKRDRMSSKFKKGEAKCRCVDRKSFRTKDYGNFLKNLPGFDKMFLSSKNPLLGTKQRTTTDINMESKLKSIFSTIINTVSDIDANSLYTSHPSLKCLTLSRIPNFKTSVQEPSSLDAIMNNVQLVHYKSFQDFNDDFNKLLDHIQKEEIFNPDVEAALLNVKRVYKEASREVISLFGDIALKPLSPVRTITDCIKNAENKSDSGHQTFCGVDLICDDSKRAEDSAEVEIIRCICNIYRDEGLMIQCEKCERWQHCMCMNVKGDEDQYMCEICDPRPISKEVLLIPQPADALAHCRYYMTLMRDEHLQVRVGDCVYVTREGSNIDIKTFRTQRDLHLIKEQLDIFRVERLWRKYNGDGCAFGHYYMRPHETFHEANRKFYPNEVFRAPLYHVVPIEAIVGTCCVMDPITFCKGHPIGIRADDVYVCEFRVDKSARLFSRINKSQHTINTNSYCFHHHPTKLKPRRTLMVHCEDGGTPNA